MSAVAALATGLHTAAVDVDDLRIQFSAGSLTTLKIVLGTILFGVALDTPLASFRAALRRPGVIAIGIVAQFLLLPALTFVLSLALGVRGSVALGMILVACCPPGNVSNILTHRSRGDVALSVSMTSVGNLLSIVAMPLNFAFWGGLHPTGGPILDRLGAEVSLSVADILGEVALVILLPFALGITIARLWPRVASTGRKILGPVSFLALGALIAVGIATNWDVFTHHLGVVVVAVAAHDALALLIGYGIARATRLPVPATRAMTFEVGIRNAGLGLLLVFTFFGGLGGMALVAAWWGIWDIIAGLAVAQWWRSRTPVPVSDDAAAEVRA